MAVYTYLRLIVDHHGTSQLQVLRQKEVDFCISLLRERVSELGDGWEGRPGSLGWLCLPAWRCLCSSCPACIEKAGSMGSPQRAPCWHRCLVCSHRRL